MHHFKKACVSVIVILLFNVAFSQSVIEYIDLDSTKLDTSQLESYRCIVNNEDFANHRFVRVNNLISVQDSGRVNLNLAEFICPNVNFLVRDVEYIDEGNYTWYGEIVSENDDPCSDGMMFLLAFGGELFGYIRIDTVEYLYHDLGGGVQVLAQLAAPFGDYECEIASTEQISGELNDIQQCNSCEVKVFAHYTPLMRSKHGWRNMAQRIRTSIALMNQGLRNSAVSNKIKVSLAGISVLEDFVESKNLSEDLDRYAGRPDVRATRLAHQADIAVLFLKSKDPYKIGMTKQRGLGGSEPYAVVDTKSATNRNYTFAHEIGHLMNADHLFRPVAPGYNKAHEFWIGWLFKNTRATTLMNDRIDGQKYEILYFSNPDVNYKNTPTGIENDRDNARAIDEFGCTTANFYPNPVLPVTGIISGYNTACACKNADYWVTPGCGTAPYTYEWQISYDGINFQPVGSNSDRYSLRLLCLQQIYNLFIRVIITDATGGTATLQKTVLVVPTWSVRTCDPGVETEGRTNYTSLVNGAVTGGDRFTMSVMPQPATNYVMININSNSKGYVTLEFIEANGRLVKKRIVSPLSEGGNTIKVDISTLPRGVYFVTGKTDAGFETKKLIVN